MPVERQVKDKARQKPYEQLVERRFYNYRAILYLCMAAMGFLFFTMSMLYFLSKSYAGDGKMDLPWLFIANTALVFLSSLSLEWARIFFERDNSFRFRVALWGTAALGLLFIVSQAAGLLLLHYSGYDLIRSNAASYLWVISGLHGLHLLGGLGFLGYYLYKVHVQLDSFAFSPVFSPTRSINCS